MQKKQKLADEVYKSLDNILLVFLKKLVSNAIGIRHYRKKELIICVSSTFSFCIPILYYKFPMILIFVVNYISLKTFFEVLREAYFTIKYKFISDLFDGKVRVIAVKDKHKYTLHSWIPRNEVEGKLGKIEHMLDKKITDFSQPGQSLKHMVFQTEDRRARNHLKSDYKLEKYMKTMPPKGLKIPFMAGIKTDGKILWLDLDELQSVLVGATPGAGKSILEHTIIHSLMHYNRDLNFVMIDYKTLETCFYENFGNTRYADTPADSLKVLKELYAEMQSRYKIMKGKVTHASRSKVPMPPVILIIDEVACIKLETPDKEMRQEIETTLQLLVNKGRAASIYVVMFSQKVTDDFLAVGIRAMTLCRIGGRTQDGNVQRALGVKGTETLGVGQFKIVTSTNQIGEVFKAFYVDIEKPGQLFQGIKQKYSREGVNFEKGNKNHL